MQRDSVTQYDINYKIMFYFVIILFSQIGFTQTSPELLSVTTTSDYNTLITDQFISGNGIEICNPNSSINANITDGFSSFGTFTRNENNFPFENGIFLTTGNAAEAGNSRINTLNSGSESWQGDTDLENALNLGNSKNATVLEFEFIALTNSISFNYVLASQEYEKSHTVCTEADGFAILIKKDGDSNYKNIATIPGTNVPVSSKEINGEDCSNYVNYYENEVPKIESTNYYGQTTALTASTTITPLEKYKIKFVIADIGETTFDSAVFIEQTDVDLTVDLGTDIKTCTTETLEPTLQSDLGVDSQRLDIQYSWFNNGNPILNANGTPYRDATYSTDTPGDYSVELEILKPNCNVSVAPSTFTISDNINLDVLSNAPIPIAPSTDFSRCSSEEELFILSNFNNYISEQVKDNGIPGNNFDITYSNTAGNNITESSILPGDQETIFVEVTSHNFDCTVTLQFDLKVDTLPIPEPVIDFPRCDNDLNFNLDDLNSQFITGNLDDFKVTYHYTEYQAENGTQAISGPYLHETNDLFVRVENINSGCFGVTTLSLQDIISPKLNDVNIPIITGCSPTSGGGITRDQLDQAQAEILNELDVNNLDISYFKTETDAENLQNELTGEVLENYLDKAPSYIYIRVQSLTNSCPSIAQIVIYPNIKLLLEEPQKDYGSCGQNVFNLKQIASEKSSFSPDLKISFHTSSDYSSPDISNEEQYSITGTSQIIYVKLEFNDGNCTATHYTDFTLFVEGQLDYNPTPHIQQCSTDRIMDLSSYDYLIDHNNNGYNIDYFLSEENRDLNQNILPKFIDYKAIIDGTLYARVSNSFKEDANKVAVEGDCHVPIEIKVDIIDMPQVNVDFDNFQYCVTNPEKEISLDQLIAELGDIIESTPANSHIDINNLDFKLYNDIADAENGTTNFITNPETEFTSNTKIYARITNTINTSICPVIIPIDVEVYLEPIFNQTSFFACDSPTFKIADIDPEQLFEHYLPEIGFTFYDSEGGTLLTNNTSIDVSNGPVTIFVEARNTTNYNCNPPEGINITLNTVITPEENIVDEHVCVISGQSETQIDLNITASKIDAGNGLNITFYPTEADAEARTQEIDKTVPFNISTASTRTNIYVRIENPQTTVCYRVQPLLIRINDIPDFSSATINPFCATNYTGSGVIFDLTQTENTITTKLGFDPPNIYYFENKEDADALNLANQIQDLEYYEKPIDLDTIWVVAQDPHSDCYETQPLALTVTLPPDTKDLTVFNFCPDGTGLLNLKTIDNRLVYNLDTTSISYYTSNTDANTGSNPLDLVAPYNFTANETLYARVESTTTGCFIIKSFTLNPIQDGRTLNVTADVTFLQNSNSIAINVSGGVGNYLYSLDNGEFQSSNIFTNVSIGEHTVFVNDNSGCSEGYVTTFVIDFPKFFTPNNDGYNETWHIAGVSQLDEVEIQIFDRYGKLLKIIDHLSPGWDGLYNGEPMPTNDYWYVAKIKHNGKNYESKGHFTLKR